MTLLDAAQSVIIVIAIVGFSLIFLWLLNRLWPPVQRGVHNNIVGWQVSVLGTTYAVIIGFMLYTVWTDFTAAEVNADAEANALVNLSRLAEGLPAGQRNAIQTLAERYAESMIEQEWPAMNEGKLSPVSTTLTHELWAALMTPGNFDAFQQTNLDHSIFQLSDMTAHRRIRQLQSQSNLPGVLWMVLIIGAVMTIASCCLFGTENNLLHGLQVLALSLLLGVCLVAIADIDRPFQGSVHVASTPFVRARETMQMQPAAH